jgi:putative oxygen-independent coproporphyrinogen III oxidase
MTALYIHYPFCKKKCPYCDFNSHVRQQVDHQIWQQAMIVEMNYMAEIAQTTPLTSIFFGGGTPSLMNASMVEALIAQAEKIFGFDDNIEITLEANPTSFEAQKFNDFKQAGVNRLSLGVQALNDDDLKFLGREHSASEAMQVLQKAQQIFPRFSFDLIYARPNQTLEQWQKELNAAMQFAPTHLSLYQLTIEEETPFARMYAKGNFALPNDEIALELYEVTEQICEQNNLYAYEVSNYATPSEQSKHNLSYWLGDDYVGIGAGAHGRIITHQGEWAATQTYKSPERWLEHVQKHHHALEVMQPITPQERAEETLMTGLRLRQGIELAKIRPALNKSKAQLLQQMNLINITDTHLIVSESGRYVLENIAKELIL